MLDNPRLASAAASRLRSDHHPVGPARRARHAGACCAPRLADKPDIVTAAGQPVGRLLGSLAAAVGIYGARHGENDVLYLTVLRPGLPPAALRLAVAGDATFGDLVLRAAEDAEAGVPAGELPMAVAAHAITPAEAAGFEMAIAFGAATNWRIVIDYDARLFREDTVAVAAAAIGEIMAAGLADRSCPCHRLGGPDDRQGHLVAAMNDTAHGITQGGIVDCIAASWSVRPDAVAVTCRGDEISWGALDGWSDRIAASLAQAGVSRGDVVGLLAGRSAGAIAGMVGILKAGAGYLPLDVDWPAERVCFCMANAGARVLIADRKPADELPFTVTRSDALRGLPRHPASRVAADACELAYYIYTSGSTGTPKGVMLDQRGRVSNFEDFNRRFAVDAADALLAVSSLCFDMTAYDALGSLMAGARVVMLDDAGMTDPASWADLMRRQRVTVWHSVPSMLALLVDEIDRLPPSAGIPSDLRLLLLGGDWIPVGLAERARRIWPAARIVSLGGATELSMDSLVYEAKVIEPNWKSIPYGRPMSNQIAYVLDTRGRPAPIGIGGQLHLGGCGVAWGYAGAPALTAAKFTPDAAAAGQRLYATGDWARLMPDGELELLGRMDFQVKINGVRIELSEVEMAVRQSPNVREAIAMVVADGAGVKRLGAWLTVDAPQDAVVPELRTRLARQLPPALRPHFYVVLDRLPQLSNGKVDRRQLRHPDPVPPAQPQAGRDALETVVCAFFADAIAIPAVGPRDNFFDRGGHSMQAFRLMSSFQDAFDVAVPLRLIFEAPTPADFAVALRGVLLGQGLDPDEALAGWRSGAPPSSAGISGVV